MASAVQLNATATITSGQGLAANSDLLSAVNEFKNLPTTNTVANVFATAANVAANAKSAINISLNNLGNSVDRAQWLIDFWPSNIAPACSNTVSFYGNNTTTASFIQNLNTQANLAFVHGQAGFANVLQQTIGYATKSFDTVSSASLLQDKTYADGGVDHTGIHDLITGGLGAGTAVYATVIANWGTMYDYTNLNLFADPYVFGQNLLNHGLGSYGNLAVNLTAAGLDTSDITKTPPTVTTVSHVDSTLVNHTAVGQIELPVIKQTATTNTVTGSSLDVILSIYRQVTGSDLTAIVSATGFTSTMSSQLQTLADYLDFNKVIDPANQAQLRALGINSLNELGVDLHKKIGQGIFTSWAQISEFLNSIEVPALHYTSTSASDSVLSQSALDLVANTVSGSGPYGNPVIADFLGAGAGMNYTNNLLSLIDAYAELSTGVLSALQTLDSEVVTWKNNYVAVPEYIPPTTAVDAAVSSVNTALNSVPTTARYSASETAYIKICNTLSTEVSNLNRAQILFGAGTADQLTNFATRFADTASDKDRYQTYQFFSNIITHDAAGDTLRASVAETINYNKLLSVGINIYNNPEPASAIANANAQNIPLSTYLSQNK